MQAIWSGNPEAFSLILNRVDPNMRHPRFGRTLFHDVAALVGEHVAAASPQMAAHLLRAGARIDERDDILKSTPLGWACRSGRLSLVQFLLANGADPDEPDAEPWATPRAWATKQGHSDVLELLNRNKS
jgi:ankyrin repeat protein